MKALVSNFGEAPEWTRFEDPIPEEGELLVNVSAVGLTNLVKGQSNGSHYSVKGDKPPFVPGTEGVGKLESGERVFFFRSRKPFGSMAEKTLVKKEFYVPLADEAATVWNQTGGERVVLKF